MAQLNFNARAVEPDTGIGDPLPTGWYNAVIDETSIEPTNSGTGTKMKTRFSVIDGQHKGRKVFFNFNIRNENPQAQEIAYRQLSAVCHAVNVFDVQDSNQLHNIPLKIRVVLRPAGPGGDGKHYEASNDIKAFRNINEPVDQPAGQHAAAPGFAPPPQQQPQAPQQWGAPVPTQQAPTQFGPPAGYPPPQQQPAYAPPAVGYPAPAAQPWQGAAPGQGAPNVPPQAPQQPAQPWAQQQAPQQPQQPAPAPQQPAQQAPQPWAQGAAGAVPPWQQPR